jgi:hypothetical protein
MFEIEKKDGVRENKEKERVKQAENKEKLCFLCLSLCERERERKKSVIL